MLFIALDFSNLNHYLLKITSVPKAGRSPDHVNNFDIHSGPWTPSPKIVTLQTRAHIWPQLGGLWILGFSKVLKVQPLDICRNTSILTGLNNLFSVLCMNCLCLTSIWKQEFLCWAVSGALLSKPPLSCTSRHSLGCCFHLNHGDTITHFSQGCPRVAALSFAWEHFTSLLETA